jgi:hypothetical protein
MVYLNYRVESGNRKKNLKRREKRTMGRELRDRLRAIDPELNIIPGGVRRRRREAAEADWLATGGIICKTCGAEVVRLIEGECPQCYKARVAEKEKVEEDRSMRRYFRRALNKGTLSLADLRDGRLGS